MKEIGKFSVKSGTIRVSDPCYSPDTWCAGPFPAHNGTWTAFIEVVDEGSWGKMLP